MRFLHLRLFALLALLVGTWDGAARAQPSVTAPASDGAQESDQLIEEGLKLREQGRDAEALPLFERAKAFRPSPRASAQLALVNQALGNWVEAERGLTAALESADDPWISQRRAVLEKALATVQSQLGWLEVATNISGADVVINGALVGSTPIAAPLRIPAGLVSLKVTAAGREPVLRLINLMPGEHAHEALVLQPESGPGPSTEGGPRAETPDTEENGTPARSTGVPTRTLAWLALGGGATLLAGGAAATAVRYANVATWNDDATCLRGTATRAQTCSQYQSTANTATALSIVGYATGGALAVTSLILFLRSPSEPARAHADLAPRCGIGVLTMWCGGSF